MNIAEIKPIDIANGPGVRVSVFVSGCTHHCPGCFNEVAWDFNYGRHMNNGIINDILEMLAPNHIKGLTVLGGEPMAFRNQSGVLRLLEKVRAYYPNKTIWLYTGYTMEEIWSWYQDARGPAYRILNLIDVLVDGPFVQDLKDLSLRFKGSSNQRIIDMNASRETGKIELWWGKDSPMKLPTKEV